MNVKRTHYEILGIERTASPAEIKARYHEIARRFHPDRAQDKVLAERLFAQVNLAYRTLINRELRVVYDASLFQSESSGESAAANPIAAQVAQPPAAQQQPATPPPQLDVMEAMWRAHAAYMNGDRISAHKICAAVLKFDSMNAEARILAGDMYADQRRFDEALDQYQAAASIGQPTFTLQQKIARMETLLGRPSKSRPKHPPQSSAQSAPGE